MRIQKLSQILDCEVDLEAYDKSLSHRAAIFSLLCDKESKIENFLCAEDTLNTLKIIEQLGAKVFREGSLVKIFPPKEILSPSDVLYCGNSGTTMRLLMGFLAAKKGFFILNGDKYLNARPMKRIAQPLKTFGADLTLREDNFAPLAIKGKELAFINYESPLASAQVKTALLLAGLSSQGAKITEPALSRNHSENMLNFMGANIKRQALEVEVQALKQPLQALDIKIPNDASSCFYFALAAAILPKAKILLKNVLLNETRIEAYKILQKMGAKLEFFIKENSYENIGDIYIEQADLKAVEVSENIAWLIDEIPALAVAFAFAQGKSRVRNAKELRFKESDRIKATVEALEACGIQVQEFEDGFEILGGQAQAALIDSKGDHRIAMSFMIMGLKTGMEVQDCSCIETSFPNFIENLKKLGAKIENRIS